MHLVVQLLLGQTLRVRLQSRAGDRVGTAVELLAVFVDELIARMLHFRRVSHRDRHLLRHRLLRDGLCGYGTGLLGVTGTTGSRGDENTKSQTFHLDLPELSFNSTMIGYGYL